MKFLPQIFDFFQDDDLTSEYIQSNKLLSKGQTIKGHENKARVICSNFTT